MTEDQIERRVERDITALDRVFLGGNMSQREYDAEIGRITDWAERQYRAAIRATEGRGGPPPRDVGRYRRATESTHRPMQH